jgi:hypothetical protein
MICGIGWVSELIEAAGGIDVFSARRGRRTPKAGRGGRGSAGRDHLALPERTGKQRGKPHENTRRKRDHEAQHERL